MAPAKKALTGIERATIVPGPAQPDPYSREQQEEEEEEEEEADGGREKSSSTAFSRLMVGKAEDSAWATAASGRKQAGSNRRMCPFYKIITGFSVCVDAFRYGAVQGCNAYFLSHFHSDHYGGLTASWDHGPIYCSKVTANLVRQQLRVDPKWIVDMEFEKKTEIPGTGGVQVTMIAANHCPGSSLFLFEKRFGPRVQRVLHCGDFRASPEHLRHALLRPQQLQLQLQQKIDICYLDTTYLNPKYTFPSQEDVVRACADMCVHLDQADDDSPAPWEEARKKGNSGSLGEVEKRPNNSMSRFFPSITVKNNKGPKKKKNNNNNKGRLLVVIGTYSIGKERICLGIARALQSKIYATPQKARVCSCLEDEELSSLLTDNPVEAQVHMQTMFEIGTDTLSKYLDSMKPHFTRVVGLRPTGWNYRPPAGSSSRLSNPSVSAVLHSDNWKSSYSVRDMVPQRGSTKESACFGVPYSEHSSFRELTMFCCGLRIARVIPTVNVGSQQSRDNMKAWFGRWEAEKRKNGLFDLDGDGCTW